MPQWMFEALQLSPGDTVNVSFLRLQMASLVVLQPVDSNWDKLLELCGTDPTEVLEREINKYSSLTAGSTISIESQGIQCRFHVKSTMTETGVAAYGVRVQDSDVRVEIDRSVVDNLNKKKI